MPKGVDCVGIRTVRNARLSLFQSAVDDLILRTHPQERTSEQRPTLDHPMVLAAATLVERLDAGAALENIAPPPELAADAGDTAWQCTKLAAALWLAMWEGRQEDAARLEDELKFGPCDPGWLEVIEEYLEHFGPGTHHQVPYVTYKQMGDFVLDVLPPQATVALIADWGTGTGEAKALLQQVAAQDPDVVVHLGDIYYSGTAHETTSNFLSECNQLLERDNGRPAVYTLSGNHDMYSGGDGYYGLIRILNPSPSFDPAWAQPASFFSLRTTDSSWQLLAMDTGLNDRDPFTLASDITFLEPREAAWHLDKISGFAQQHGKTILLSHHQLFSPFSYIGGDTPKPAGQEAYNPKLLATFEGEIAAGNVAAWFWGHEHNLGIYQPYGSLERGRCIGHAAIPVYETEEPYQVDARIPNPPLLVDGPDGRPLELPLNQDGVYGHGYVILRLDGANGSAEAAYYDSGNGSDPVYTEVID